MSKLFDTSIESLITDLRKQRVGKRIFAFEQLLERRIARDGGTPIIEGDKAYFFFRSSDDEKISVTGDWNKWQPRVDMLSRINPKSDFYFLKKEFPIDARLSYRFQLENSGSMNDPLNPNALQEVFGKNTFLRMPGYVNPEYLTSSNKANPKGKWITVLLPGTDTIASREARMYIPKGLNFRKDKRLLFILDGGEAITIGNFDRVMDNLYAAQPLLPKVTAIFIPPVDRHVEYAMNPYFADWLAKDVLKSVEKRLKIKTKAEHRAIQGASLGGLCAAYTGFLHSNTFGKIIVQSGSFWIANQEMVKLFEKSKNLGLEFFLHSGTIHDALEGTRAMLIALQQKGYPVTYRQSSESHNWANWCGKYAEILQWCVA
ncbi:MAG: alpha/beta hydrolase-fold protein [bacterium]